MCLRLFLGILVFFWPGASATEGEDVVALDEDDVLVLNTDNFAKILNSSKRPFLIKFYDPACTYSKALAPEFASAAHVLKTSKPPVRLAEVNGVENKGLVKVDGFPTITLVKKGKGREYKGAHTSQALVTWTMKVAGPLITELETPAEAEQFDRYDMTVIGLFEEGSDDKMVDALKKVAPQVSDVLFAYATSPTVIARYEGEDLSVPAVRMVFPHDEKRRTYLGDFGNASALLEFVQKYRHPAVSAFNSETATAMFEDGRPLLVLFRNSDQEGMELEKVFRDVAPRLDRQMIAIVAGSTDPSDRQLMQVLGVKSDDFPLVRIENTKYAKKFNLQGTFSEARLHGFTLDYLAGRLKPVMRSAPAPLQSGPVHTLVGSTFEDVVRGAAKDVLVYFYAPWCEPCQKFTKVYDRIAEKLKGVETLVLAKMDGSENDFEGDDLQGYPGFRLWRANNKDKPLSYDGELEEDYDGDIEDSDHPLVTWLLRKVRPRAGKGAARGEL